MKVYTRGDGSPEYSIVGSLHGDEPAGKKAIENIIAEDWEFNKPVQFIVANEKALERETRFVDTDLNRVFPGDRESELYEERLAAELMDQIGDTKVLDIHTTRSYSLPFATFTSEDEESIEMVRETAVENAILFPEKKNTLHSEVNGIVVEAGFQQTEMAVHNAEGVIINFLASEGAIDAEFGRSDPEIFQYIDTVEGEWEFEAENFRKVKKGQVYARNSNDELRAEQDFYPVLMSTDGYRDILGFRARKMR